jgi:hypothetical protein
MQTGMAGMLRLSFQLDSMDYRRDNWQRADLELSTFRRLQVPPPAAHSPGSTPNETLAGVGLGIN